MPSASYVQSSFIGGLVSKWTQGRYHDPHYRTWMDTCLNGLPTETESWTRRPGFGFAGPTRGGATGRLFKFDFEAVAPYTMEFTDGNLRMWQAATPATTNDSVGLTSISGANPAELTLASAVTWSTGDEIFLSGLGTTCPTLQNRRLTITVVDTTHVTITDAITGSNINGSGIGTPSGSTIVNHVLDISTVYTSGAWSTLRSVQTEQAAFLLHSQFPPYELVVATDPVGSNFATFNLTQAFFEDGPYLDPINGVTVTPGATSGITTLTLGFQAYSSTQAYTTGDFVVSSSVGYQSLQDANVNNTPSSSPSFWKVVGFGAAINNGQGFVAGDIGRLVRLFSEPPLWLAATTYASGAMVSFNPSNLPGQEVYYSALTGANVGNTPGIDATHWQLVDIGSTQNPAVWTWGKITGLTTTGAISGATGTNIGNLTSNGGLSAAFDGNTTKKLSASAAAFLSSGGFGFVGKDYGGQTISQAVIYPSTDGAFCLDGGKNKPTTSVDIALRASSTAPSVGNSGTLLGTTGTIANTFSPITIVSNDTVTSWNYVWIDITATSSTNIEPNVAQVIFYSNSASPGTAVNVEILGPPLLYSATAMPNWRLGLYSNTTGWPNVGTYAEGRLWLASAAFPNRFDACVANGISGVNNGALPGTVNFAPTDQYGNVTDANAISYTFNAPDVNPILWMIPDVQGVVMGTLAGEWLVQAPTSGGISPTNIVGRRMTLIGCANIEPRRTEHTIIVVQRFLRKIVEFFADVFSGKFSAPNLTKDAKQLTIGNIQEIAYQQELCPIIWARVNNGLIGSTYKRDTLMTSAGPTMNGWHEHSLGSSRDIESLVVGSSVNGTLDALTLITNDTNASDTAFNVRFVEVLAPIPDEGTLLSAAPYLDAAITPSSTASVASGGSYPYGALTLNGLWYLNGYTCTAWLGGLDCGDYAVSNGSITVPFGNGTVFPPSSGANRSDQGLFTSTFVSTGVTANGVTMWAGTMPMLVGFTYTSQGRIVRPNSPPESGARSGPAFGKLRRSEWIMAQFEGSQGVSWGTDFSNLLRVSFRQADDVTAYTVDQQFTGIARDNVDSTYTFDSRLCWQVTRPYICNVQAIGAALETADL